MQLNKRDQVLIVLLGVVLACGAIWYFWLAPTTQTITADVQKISSLGTDQASLQQRLNFIDVTSKDLAKNTDAQKLISLAAPSGSGMDNMLASLNAMAVTSGVSLMSVQPQATTTQPNQLDVSVSISGTFSAIEAFVGALEKNERPISIQSMSLSSAATTDGSTLIAATLNLVTVQASAAKSATASTAGGTQ